MLNEVYTISNQIQGRATLNWNSANAEDVSWVYVNGVLQHGPALFGTTQRSAPIRFSKDLNKCIEIHDFVTNIGRPSNICIKENSRPSIEWNAKSGDQRYRIYHTPPGGSESKISEIFVEDDRSQYKVNSPIRLGEGWHLFRVEAVNVYGIESTRQIWPYRVFRIPTPVNDLTIVNGSGSGLFDITIS